MPRRRFVILPEYRERGVRLPQRQTAASAGYDLAAAAHVEIPACGVALVPTGLAVEMPADEYLAIHLRSGLGVRGDLALANGTGIIDADYFASSGNGGHILVALRNLGTSPVVIAAGERVAQGIFQRYQRVEDDEPGGPRAGGFGSTGNA